MNFDICQSPTNSEQQDHTMRRRQSDLWPQWPTGTNNYQWPLTPINRPMYAAPCIVITNIHTEFGYRIKDTAVASALISYYEWRRKLFESGGQVTAGRRSENRVRWVGDY